MKRWRLELNVAKKAIIAGNITSSVKSRPPERAQGGQRQERHDQLLLFRVHAGRDAPLYSLRSA